MASMIETVDKLREIGYVETPIPYYQLTIRLDPTMHPSVIEAYKKARDKHNQNTVKVLTCQKKDFDAGFDLYCPKNVECKGFQTTELDLYVRCCMDKVDLNPLVPVNVNNHNSIELVPGEEQKHLVGYYLYPRSSTGTKTPLRLCHSLGIIDSGYRGNIKANFDNWKSLSYNVEMNQRLVQICPPDLSYPLFIVITDSMDELGNSSRGFGGFGSTGI